MDHQPLAGRRIVVTRAQEQAGGLVARLRELGAEPVVCSTITFAPPDDPAPLDAAIARIEQYDWVIVTSANGARALLERMRTLGRAADALRGVAVGAVGPATLQTLAEYGVEVRFVPSAHVAEAMLEEIGDVAGRRVLLPRADIARANLPEGLRARGAAVDDIAAYRTVRGPGSEELVGLLRQGAVSAVTFTSSSTVRYLLDTLEAAGLPREEARALLNRAAVVCIGPVTSATAREEQLRVDAQAREHTTAGLVQALVEWFSDKL